MHQIHIILQYASNETGGDGDDAWGWLWDSWGEWIMFCWFSSITFWIIDVLLGATNVHQCGDGDALDNKDSKESWRWQMFKTNKMIVPFVGNFGSKQDWWKSADWWTWSLEHTFGVQNKQHNYNCKTSVTNKPCILYRAVTLCIEFKVRFYRESFVIWWKKLLAPNWLFLVIFSFFPFLSVQNSQLGDLVTQSLTHWLNVLLLLRYKERPLRPVTWPWPWPWPWPWQTQSWLVTFETLITILTIENLSPWQWIPDN